ncbi:DUF3592 domain-containing protein [Pseudanabaena sp. FACHB-2040]|uniref:DUF3592 domain-containing protein n=1 Tax=Pseudanabaena sp. FACHB-2040 TaxID=2692859 RepID=UPI001683D7F3|nr:DUF3592 domain-containing protein [Pseudanabaena sp. FACHB-2040]MBD0268922.1 DUF3592 domain-containing protein [Cyanobacteria bacterium Co-bin8]MBD2258971.1 DUF3592 domain-containing protein [Pseudanabaena sp. FACHB-2040]
MKRPDFFRVVFTDFWCCTLFCVAITGAIFCVLVFTVPVSVVAAVLMFRRVTMIRDVFSKGVSVTALITRKKSAQGEWLLRYTYQYNDVAYERGNYIVRNWIKLNRGDRTEVFVNPQKPQEAFLTAFYLG